MVVKGQQVPFARALKFLSVFLGRKRLQQEVAKNLKRKAGTIRTISGSSEESLWGSFEESLCKLVTKKVGGQRTRP